MVKSVIGQINISGRAIGILFVEIIGLAVDKNISSVLPVILKLSALLYVQDFNW